MESVNNYTTSIIKLIEYYIKDDQSNNVLLDPFSCILKLGILFYKPLGTKLSITKNSIQYNVPSLYQGALRTYTGDSRDDLHNICYPIMMALNWYSKEDERFKFFFEQCVLGLTYLKNNYDRNSLINHTISHYIDLINNNSNDIKSISGSPIINSLEDFWKNEEIDIIYSLFKYALKNDDNDKLFYISMIEKIIYNKEQKLNLYVNQVITQL